MITQITKRTVVRRATVRLNRERDTMIITKRNGQPATSDVAEAIVKNKNDLPDAKAERLAPGSLAYTADLKNIWQLDIDRNWVPIVGGG